MGGPTEQYTQPQQRDVSAFMNLDVSEIRWKDVTPVAQGDMGKSMLDSIIFEFQEYIGRRSNSAPRKSTEKAEEEIMDEVRNDSN